MNIEYTERSNVIALYDRTESQVEDYMHMIESLPGHLTIKRL